MFNIGNNDKEKLKENMDEIKDLINKDGGKEVESSPSQSEEFSKITEQSSKTKNLKEEKEELENELESSLQDLEERENAQTTDDGNTSNKNKSGKPPQQGTKTHSRKVNRETETKQKMTKPSGSSLFLRVERFRNIEGLVEEMKNLTSQIDRQIDDLEQTNNQDKQIKEETQRILSEYDSRRQSMKDSLLKKDQR